MKKLVLFSFLFIFVLISQSYAWDCINVTSSGTNYWNYTGGNINVSTSSNLTCINTIWNVTGNITIYGNLTLSNVRLTFNLTANGSSQIHAYSGSIFNITNSSNLTSNRTDASFFGRAYPNSTFQMHDSFMSYCGNETGYPGQYPGTVGFEISSNNTIIRNNTFKENSNSVAISLNYSYNSRIYNNTFTKTQNRLRGILIYQGSNNTVYNNTLSNLHHGIYLYTTNNNTIENNTISNGDHGIFLYSYSTNNTISNNVIYDNTKSGVRLESGNEENIIENNNIYSNGIGIHMAYACDNNTITTNSINQNNYGITIESSDNNTITTNTIINSANYGLYIWDDNSDDNTIYNNYFSNNNINAYDPDISSSNKWNITKIAGTNIIGNYYLGGNYWDDYNGTDIDGDSIADTNVPYNSNNNINSGGDYAPLSDRYFIQGCVYDVNSVNYSFNINWNITESTNCIKNNEQIQLLGNLTIYGNLTLNNVTLYFNQTNYKIIAYSEANLIINSSDISHLNTITIYTDNSNITNNRINSSIRIFGNNIIINNNTIITNAAGSYSIYIAKTTGSNNFENITISNNNLDGYQCGIYAKRANLTINNNTIHDSNYGIRIYNSSVSINNNTLKNIQYLGIYLEQQSNYSSVTGNLIANGTGSNSEGIDIGESSHVIVENNTIYNVSYGIGFYDLENIRVYNNTVYDSINEGIACWGTATNSNITNNTVYNTFNPEGGLVLWDCSGTRFFSNIVYNNSYGIYVTGSSSNNYIYNNYFYDNSKNAYDSATGANYYNITKQLDTNIVNGPYLGGNYWDDYNGTDTDNDEIGNTNIPYVIGTSTGYDYLPLVKQPPVISNGNPSGTVTGSTQTLSVITNENAQCRYSTTPGTSSQ